MLPVSVGLHWSNKKKVSQSKTEVESDSYMYRYIVSDFSVVYTNIETYWYAVAVILIRLTNLMYSNLINLDKEKNSHTLHSQNT